MDINTFSLISDLSEELNSIDDEEISNDDLLDDENLDEVGNDPI